MSDHIGRFITGFIMSMVVYTIAYHVGYKAGKNDESRTKTS